MDVVSLSGIVGTVATVGATYVAWRQLRMQQRGHQGSRALGPERAPRQLPANVARFVGRTADLAVLGSLLDGAAGRDEATLIAMISGHARCGRARIVTLLLS